MANVTLIDNNNNYTYNCSASYAASVIGVHKNTITRWKAKAKENNEVKEVYNQFEIIFIDEDIKQPPRNVNANRFM